MKLNGWTGSQVESGSDGLFEKMRLQMQGDTHPCWWENEIDP